MNSPSFLLWYRQGLGLVLVCVFMGYLLTNADLLSSFNQNWIDRDVRDSGIMGAIYFFGLGVFVSALGAPRQLIAFLGGYAFGSVVGTTLATVATLGGCIFTFYTAKILIKPFVRKHFFKQAHRINIFLSTQATRKTIVIRLLPIGSNVLTNLIAGSTNVSPQGFFLGSFIGYLPQMFIFSLLGKGMLINSEWKITLSLVLFFVSSYLSFSLYKKHKQLSPFSTSTRQDCEVGSEIK